MLGNSWHKRVVKVLLLPLRQHPFTPTLLALHWTWFAKMTTSGTSVLCDRIYAEPSSIPYAFYIKPHSRRSSLGDLARLREEVLQGVQDLIFEWQDHTIDGGRAGLPIFRKYTGMPTSKSPRIRKRFGLGHALHAGSGWLPRMDERYAHPCIPQGQQTACDEQACQNWMIGPGRLEGPFISPADCLGGTCKETLQPLPTLSLRAPQISP